MTETTDKLDSVLASVDYAQAELRIIASMIPEATKLTVKETALRAARIAWQARSTIGVNMSNGEASRLTRTDIVRHICEAFDLTIEDVVPPAKQPEPSNG